MPPELIVRVIGDTSQLEKGFKRAQKATGNLEKDLGRSSRGAIAGSLAFKGLGRSVAFASGAFLGGAGLAAALKSSIDAASNLNEQISKTNVVFGRSAEEVKAWSETSASALGLAQDQALAVASSFGALFRPLGLVGAEAARQSEQLTQLGADLASFYNTDVQQALDALRSGLVGESEPLRQYGILLSETRVQAEALAETHKHSAKELTNLDKVQARINIIQKDSAAAQGDLSRTQGGFANQTRQLAANLRDLGATIGGPLVSGLAVEFKGWNQILGAINKVGDATKKVQISDTELRVVVPRLAAEYERFRKAGLGVADAHKRIVAEFGDAKHGADLLGAALDYIVNPEMRAKVARLATSIGGVGLAAEDAAKAVTGIALAAAARAAAVPRGMAFLGPGTKLGIALAQARLTPSTADDMAILVKQRELNAQKLRSLQNRLAKATGAKARDLADQLQQVLTDDASALGEIVSIQDANAQAAADAAAKAKAAAEKRAKAAKKLAEAITAANKTRLEALAKEIKAGQAYTRSFAALLTKRARENANARRTKEERKVFGLIGLTATGEDRAPSRGNLQAALTAAQAAAPAGDKALRSRLAGLRTVINTEFSKLTRDTKIKVGEFLDALAGKDKGSGQATTKRQAASLEQLIRGTGLDAAGLRRLEFNLAGAHLTVPVRGARATVVHTNLYLDGTQVARNTTEHQERDGRRRAYQTRGRVR